MRKKKTEKPPNFILVWVKKKQVSFHGLMKTALFTGNIYQAFLLQFVGDS
jgi:hypothetical protein